MILTVQLGHDYSLNTSEVSFSLAQNRSAIKLSSTISISIRIVFYNVEGTSKNLRKETKQAYIQLNLRLKAELENDERNSKRL